MITVTMLLCVTIGDLKVGGLALIFTLIADVLIVQAIVGALK